MEKSMIIKGELWKGIYSDRLVRIVEILPSEYGYMVVYYFLDKTVPSKNVDFLNEFMEFFKRTSILEV